MQYLIGKLLDMVKMGQENLVVALLLASVRASWKVAIYYLNKALLILNRKPQYVYKTNQGIRGLKKRENPLCANWFHQIKLFPMQQKR